MRLALRLVWLGIVLACVGMAGILFNHVWGGTWLLIGGGALAIVTAATAAAVG